MKILVIRNDKLGDFVQAFPAFAMLKASNPALKLTALVPEARVVIGHGQMRERELERVMSDFYHQRYNVLVCSTIIETGIDVPTANTIIIERADKFVARMKEKAAQVEHGGKPGKEQNMTQPKAKKHDMEL